MDNKVKDNPKRFVQPFIVNPIKDRVTHEVVDFKITTLKARRCFGTFSKKKGVAWWKTGNMANWKHRRKKARENTRT